MEWPPSQPTRVFALQYLGCAIPGDGDARAAASCSTLVAVQPKRLSTLAMVAILARSTFSIWYCGKRSFF
jgi:hypothetical protein